MTSLNGWPLKYIYPKQSHDKVVGLSLQSRARGSCGNRHRPLIVGKLVVLQLVPLTNRLSAEAGTDLLEGPPPPLLEKNRPNVKFVSEQKKTKKILSKPGCFSKWPTDSDSDGLHAFTFLKWRSLTPGLSFGIPMSRGGCKSPLWRNKPLHIVARRRGQTSCDFKQGRRNRGQFSLQSERLNTR